MKKKVLTTLVLMVGILLAAVSICTAGDLIVTGKVGIGIATNTPSAELDVVGRGKITAPYGTGLYISSFTQATPQKPAMPLATDAYWLGGHNFGRGAVAATYRTFLKGSDTLSDATIAYQDIISQEADMVYGRGDKTDTYTFTGTDPVALRALHVRNNDNTRNMNFDNMYGLLSLAMGGTGTGGRIYTKNFYHAYFDDFRYSSVWQADNLYGLYIKGNSGSAESTAGIWVGKNTNATKNYGIVLDGDESGADISFGAYGNGERPRIYSSGGRIYAQDSNYNTTIFSPHDPETGEWIFYSKNTKTGRTVRVNMEELVKDMEKLTGKKYMIESFVNEK